MSMKARASDDPVWQSIWIRLLLDDVFVEPFADHQTLVQMAFILASFRAAIVSKGPSGPFRFRGIISKSPSSPLARANNTSCCSGANRRDTRADRVPWREDKPHNRSIESTTSLLQAWPNPKAGGTYIGNSVSEAGNAKQKGASIFSGVELHSTCPVASQRCGGGGGGVCSTEAASPISTGEPNQSWTRGKTEIQ